MSGLQRFMRMTLAVVIILTLGVASAAPLAAQDTTAPGVEPVPGTPTTTATGAALQVFDYLNVRTGPGLNFPVLVTLAPGQNFVLQSRTADGSWLQVRVPDGRVGWVSTAVITTTLNLATLPVATDVPTAVTAPSAQPAPGVGGQALGTVVNANILNVRSGPGLNFPILATLPLNQVVTLEGRNADGSWLQIRLAGEQLGWVNSAFVSPNLAIASLPVSETPAPPVAVTPPVTPTETAPGVGGLALGTVVNANNLNVRSGPGLNYGILTMLPLGSSAVLEGRDTGGLWLQIRLADGRLGWVSSAYMTANLDIANLPVIEPETAAVVETPAAEPAAGIGGLATGTVANTNLLNVRSGPGLNFPVLVVLPMGESVVLEGRDTAGFWLQVRLADGRLGWVSSAFMSANLDIANLPVTG